MPSSHDPEQNHLLGALSSAERERLYPHLRLVPMPLGKVLYESGDVLRHVYFPTDSIVSLLYVLAGGASAEISVVGNEGLTVLDRPKLEQLCCERYAVVKKETDRLLPRAHPRQPQRPRAIPAAGA